MAQKFKTTVAPLATHNVWKRHWRQRQSDRQNHPITEALTITSVNSLVMKGNACLVKQNAEGVEREPPLPKYIRKPPAGISQKEDCTSSHKPQTKTNCSYSNEAFTNPQCKEILQHSGETDSKSRQHCKQFVPNLSESKTATTQSPDAPKQSYQDKPNAVTQGFSVQSSSPSVNNKASKCVRRSSRLSCAVLQRMTCQGQMMGRKKESASGVSGESGKKDAAPNAPCLVTKSVKSAAGACSVNTGSSVPASMEHLTNISIQGSHALFVKNQHTSSSTDVFCKVSQESDNKTLSDTLGREPGPENAFKFQLVSQYTNVCMNTNKHWINPVSLTQAQLERQFLKSSSNLTNRATPWKKSRDVQTYWSELRNVPSHLPVNNCTSNRPNMNTVLTAPAEIIPDKEADVKPVKNIPVNLTEMGRSNTSTNPKSDQATREKSQINQSLVQTKNDHANQVFIPSLSARNVNSEKSPSSREVMDKCRISALKSKSITINYAGSKQNSVYRVKAKDMSGMETKTLKTNPTDSQTKPSDSENASGNTTVPQNVTGNNSETKETPANSVDVESIPGKLRVSKPNTVTLKKTFIVVPKAANTSYFPEKMNRHSALADSKPTSSNHQEAGNESSSLADSKPTSSNHQEAGSESSSLADSKPTSSNHQESGSESSSLADSKPTSSNHQEAGSESSSLDDSKPTSSNHQEAGSESSPLADSKHTSSNCQEAGSESSSLDGSRHIPSNYQEAGNVSVDVRDNENHPKTSLKTNPIPTSFSDMEQIPPEFKNAACSPAGVGEAENVTVRTDGNKLISRDLDTKHIQPNMTQSEHILPNSKQGKAAGTTKKKSVKDENTDNCQDPRNYANKKMNTGHVNKLPFEKHPVRNINTSVEMLNLENNQMRGSDTNSISAIPVGSSNELSSCVRTEGHLQNPVETEDIPTGLKDKENKSAKSDDIKSMSSEIPDVQNSLACELATDNFHPKAAQCVKEETPKVSGVNSRRKSQSEIKGISMHPDIKSNVGHSRGAPGHELGENSSECPSSGSRFSNSVSDAINAATENVAAAQPESAKTPREVMCPHGDTIENPINMGSDPVIPRKIPNAEGTNMASSGCTSSTEKCSETNKATNTAVEAKGDHETGDPSTINTAKPQTSPTHDDSQKPRTIRTTSPKRQPPKLITVNQCQTESRPKHPQRLISKQTESVYSQKLPRRTEGKNQTTLKPKGDSKPKEESNHNFAAAWVRVQSAQPQVFRSVARGASRTTQRRSKSVMDMAGNKEPTSRCHCHRRVPGSGGVRCQCNETLEESSPGTYTGTDLGRQVKWFSMLWDQCQSQKNLEKALDVLKQMPHPQRLQLVRQVDGLGPCSMLAACCKAGNVPMVDFLLNECGVDIDRKEEYHDTHSPASPTTLKNVTALWCAAVEGQVEVVRTLIQHGADIHAESANGSSAVRSACYRLQVKVVEVLLKAGADVHSPNVDGVTCLMNGCNSPELCQLLLRHGARPSDRDVSGNTALHYAAAVGQLQSLRLLQQYGGNVLDKNGAGNTVLRCAALRGWLHIVDYLAHCCGSVDIGKVIEAYELAGSTLVDLNDNEQFFKEGISAWQKALHLRHIAGIPKNCLRQEKIAPFQFLLEFSTQPELERIASDREEVRIHALLVKERICGPKNEELIQAVVSRGTMYLEAGMYRPCIDLWMHAFRLLLDPTRGLKKAHHFSPQRIVKLFLDLSEQRVKDVEDLEVLHVNDTLNLLQLLVECLNRTLRQQQQTSTTQLHGSTEDIQQDPLLLSLDVEWESYFLNLQMALHLVRIISTFQELLPDEVQRFHELVYQLVKPDHRSRSGESLLHLCFPLSKIEPGKDEHRLPTIHLLETLILCGADVDAVSKNGESPLFYIFTPPSEAGSPSFSFADKETWANLLLRYKAHVDRRTPDRRGVLRSLKRMDSFCSLSHVGLQCLAARVIRDQEIEYRDPEMLPSHLISFVDFH